MEKETETEWQQRVSVEWRNNNTSFVHLGEIHMHWQFLKDTTVFHLQWMTDGGQTNNHVYKHKGANTENNNSSKTTQWKAIAKTGNFTRRPITSACMHFSLCKFGIFFENNGIVIITRICRHVWVRLYISRNLLNPIVFIFFWFNGDKVKRRRTDEHNIGGVVVVVVFSFAIIILLQLIL